MKRKQISLKDFIFGLKRDDNKKQVIGTLFVVEDGTKDIYACALGRGLINAEIVTEEEIRRAADRDYVRSQSFSLPNGGRISGRTAPSVEDESTTWLNDTLGGDFTEWVVSKNDLTKTPISEIGVEAFQRVLPDGNFKTTDDDDEDW